MPVATAHWPRSSGAVPKASWRNGTWTTSTWRTTPNASAPHSHGLVNSPWNALEASEREFSALNSCANDERREAGRAGDREGVGAGDEPAGQEDVDGEQRDHAHDAGR